MKAAHRALLILLLLSAAVPAHADWRELETGLEIGRFDSRTRTAAPDGDLFVLRVEPRIFALQLLTTGRDAEAPERDVADWCADFDLVAAINAGMYQVDGRTHVGFCKVAGEVVNRFANDYLSVAAFDPVDPADPPFHIFDLDETPLSEVLARYHNVVQNLRLIKNSRENRWQPSAEQWRESALAEDSRGRALLVFCRTPWSMHQFNEILLALPLDVTAAQHLEGRSQARFWIEHPAYATDPAAHAPGSALPNVIGVARRYKPGSPTEPQLNGQ